MWEAHLPFSKWMDKPRAVHTWEQDLEFKRTASLTHDTAWTDLEAMTRIGTSQVLPRSCHTPRAGCLKAQGAGAGAQLMFNKNQQFQFCRRKCPEPGRWRPVQSSFRVPEQMVTAQALSCVCL